MESTFKEDNLLWEIVKLRMSSSDFLIENQSKRDFSTYLKILGGIGAYISAICFIGFFGAFGFFDDKFTRIFLGILFISVSIFENFLIKKNYSIKSSFLVQLSFAFMILGKIMFVTGFGEFLTDSTMNFDDGWNYSLALFLVTFWTYQNTARGHFIFIWENPFLRWKSQYSNH